MGWFSSKEKVPELPPLTNLSNSNFNVPELPSLPRNVGVDGNRELVKSAVNDSGEKESYMEELPRDFHLDDITEQGIPSIPQEKYEKEEHIFLPDENAGRVSLKCPPCPTQRAPIKAEPKGPVFVRIDKFQTAQKTFEQVQDKIKEMELVIKKINEIKKKEDEEIRGWTVELEKLKSKMSEIDANIFDQI